MSLSLSSLLSIPSTTRITHLDCIPRTIDFEMPMDTSHFTPFQLQAKTLLSMTWNGYARWLRTHYISMAKLMGKHRLGMAMVAANIDYLQPYTFFEADLLKVKVDVKLRAGRFLQLEVVFLDAGQPIAQTNLLLDPLQISPTEPLTTEPTQLPREFVELFHPARQDLIVAKPKRELRELADNIEQSGHLITEQRQGLTMDQNIRGVAHPWAFVELPALIESARAPLVLARQQELPPLSRCLHQPLKSFKVELDQPNIVFEKGEVETKAYQWQDELAFIHRLFSTQHPSEAHAIAIERF